MITAMQRLVLASLALVASVARADDPPVKKGEPRATQISVGAEHGCARMSDDTARCWGDDSEGELGDGSHESHTRTVTPPVTGVVEIAAGEHVTCARLRDHTVWCWGWNPFGQLGTGATSRAAQAPAPVQGLTDAIAIGVGEQHACAIRADHTVVCWGRNDDHQLGDGTADAHPTPVAAKGLDHVVAISIGWGTCARRDDGSVWCWGGDAAAVPTAIADVAHAIDVSVGGLGTCVALDDGTARCWGPADSGQLGRGDATDGVDGSAPIGPVAGLAHATAIAASRIHTCAIAGGRVLCWGAAAGNPDFPRSCLKDTQHGGAGGSAAQWKFCAKPTQVSGVPHPIGLAVSDAMSCALLAGGGVRCWHEDRRSRPL